MADYVRLGQDSELLKKNASTAAVEAYSALYVRMLGTLYRDLKAHDPIFLNGLVAQPFFFGARPDVSWLGVDCSDSLHRMVYDQTFVSICTVTMVVFF